MFGNSSPVPYFYPAYLFTLLIWRERRDEAKVSTTLELFYWDSFF
jgi:hypothetical protein